MSQTPVMDTTRLDLEDGFSGLVMYDSRRSKWFAKVQKVLPNRIICEWSDHEIMEQAKAAIPTLLETAKRNG